MKGVLACLLAIALAGCLERSDVGRILDADADARRDAGSSSEGADAAEPALTPAERLEQAIVGRWEGEETLGNIAYPVIYVFQAGRTFTKECPDDTCAARRGEWGVSDVLSDGTAMIQVRTGRVSEYFRDVVLEGDSLRFSAMLVPVDVRLTRAQQEASGGL